MSTIYNELKDFYKNKNVYITGITGFKGSWLALTLKQLGANVTGLGLDEDTITSEMVKNTFPVLIANIVDESAQDKISEHIHKNNPSVFFHLAAQPIVSEGYRDPKNTYMTNIMGTVNIHEILKTLKNNISFINVTTDKVYAESTSLRKEDDRLQGIDPYSLSKSCSDMISQSYAKLNDNVIVSTLRAGNVLGGGDFSPNRIITDYMEAYADNLNHVNNKLHLRHPESVRPYQHVFDVIVGYLIVAMKQASEPTLAGAYNIGPSKSQIATTENVVKKLNEYMDTPIEYIADGKSIGHENPNLTLDSHKIKWTMNWHPAFNTFDKVIYETASWYNSYMNDEDNVRVINEQIERGLIHYDYED